MLVPYLFAIGPTLRAILQLEQTWRPEATRCGGRSLRAKSALLSKRAVGSTSGFLRWDSMNCHIGSYGSSSPAGTAESSKATVTIFGTNCDLVHENKEKRASGMKDKLQHENERNERKNS